MEEELSFDNIMSENEIEDMFSEDAQDEENLEEEYEENTTEVDQDEEEDQPESVGSEEEDIIEEMEDTASTEDTSPNNNFYSSIASALVEDGIFQNLNNSNLNKIENAEDFAALVEDQINSRVDDRTKRVNYLLENGGEPNVIKDYELTLQGLNNVTDEMLSAEDENGENLRKTIIYRDFLNKGFSESRAAKEVEKSLQAGTDIDDAKEALKSNIDFLSTKYNEYITGVQQQQKAIEKARQDSINNLANYVVNGEAAFGLDINKNVRQRVVDTIITPKYKDPNTGQPLTELQAYIINNHDDYMRNVGTLFVLTDGFKNFDNLIKGKVNKAMKKGLRELESTLNNTARTTSGNLNYASGVDFNSRSTKWDLDI